MSNDKLEKLSKKIGSMTLGAKKERLTAITLLHKSILALLAEGKPASSDELAAITGQSKKEVKMMKTCKNSNIYGRAIDSNIFKYKVPILRVSKGGENVC